MIKEDVKALPGHVLPSVTSGSTWEHRLLLSDLIRIKVTKICKFCRRSPKRSVTAAGTELDGVYLIPSSTPKSRISKHDPTDFSASTGKTGRIQVPCPQLIKSACIFKTVLLQMDFYRQASAGTSFPQIRKEMWRHCVRITAGGSVFHSISCEWHTPTSLLRCVRTSIAVTYMPHNVVTIYRSVNKQYLFCWILSNTNA